MFQCDHVMIDIETLGLTPDTVILSIGACKFDKNGIRDDELYLELNPRQEGRTTDIDTIKWWFSQHIKPPLAGLISLEWGLNHLTDYVKGCKCVWTNGTDFDISILTHAYKSFGRAVPWPYNAVRDYRTIAKLHPDYALPAQSDQIRHNALSDAKYQARQLIHTLNSIGVNW